MQRASLGLTIYCPLRQVGMKFDEVEPKEWVQRLRASNEDAIANPPIKLVDFFASKYDKVTFRPARIYETRVARSFSRSLDSAPVLNDAFVATFVKHFQATAWKLKSPDATSQSKKQVIVLAGPCGSGKSTIAKYFSTHFRAPFIEGDELHASDAIATMAAGTPLDDLARAPWLDRFRQRALDTFITLGHERVFVSCSALKKVYRDCFRNLLNDQIHVVFLDLQVE
jgi:hypothetical protein